jgi:4'-phosphopantetheinyl transferase
MIEVHVITLDRPPISGCVRDAVHSILAAHLGRAPEVVADPLGKPVLADGALAFNVTHSGTLALVAISRQGPLGVDVEQHDARRDVVGLARRFFTAGEAALVASEPMQFWRLWCRKEAWLKARGLGLSGPLSEVDVRGNLPGWFIADLEVASGYAAAVAREGTSGEVRLLSHVRSAEILRSGSAIIARSASR